jgi:aminoglycoside 3'-phosphotransferase-2
MYLERAERRGNGSAAELTTALLNALGPRAFLHHPVAALAQGVGRTSSFRYSCSRMDLPRDLNLLLAGRRLEPVTIGKSGAGVWRCTRDEEPAWYLKVARVDDQHGLEHEAVCMRWMRECGLAVPAVLDCCRRGEVEYLVSAAGIGRPASDSEWGQTAAGVATALGRGLARLHSTDVAGCPFDRRIERQLDEARARIAAGLVREDDFDATRLGRDAADLFNELLGMVPPHEDLVFVHGDFCLPNILLSHVGGDLHVTALVDCGRAGIGDRHQDLALAMRSLTYNLGADTIAPFLSAYGGEPIDSRVLEFFTILDEFF